MSFGNTSDRKLLARAALAVGAIAGLALLGSTSLVVSEEKSLDKEKTGIIFPPDHAVLLSGSIDVICKTDTPCLVIDAQKYQWEFCGNPVRVARVRLFPGMHELIIGDKKIEVVVALNEDEHDGPADWKIQRTHEMDNDPNRCNGCHEVDKKCGVGKLKPHKACFECHDRADLKKEHPEIPNPLQKCGACHTLHGSPHKPLLKAPKRELLAKRGDPKD